MCLYIVYDSLKVTKSVVLGEEIKMLAPLDDAIDILRLRELNSDIVGWIRIPDTDIDYPILQGSDNDYYLSRNYLGEFAVAGSIFLDYRNDFGDDFLIIYGHSMS
jgi:sortase B